MIGALRDRLRMVLEEDYSLVLNRVLFISMGLIIISPRLKPTANAMSTRKYHGLLENLAIINEDKLINPAHSGRKRDTKMKHEIKHSKYLYNSVSIKIHGESSCPTRQEILAHQSFQVCPAFFVSEYDPNRIPTVIFQVRCKCLTCRGPQHKHRHTKCTPLFRFINAYRVVDRSSSGKNIYAKVREPVSYSCQCRKDVLSARRTFIPP